MDSLLFLIFNLGLIFIYFIGAFLIAVTIQLISYKIFKINLYKKLKYILIERG